MSIECVKTWAQLREEVRQVNLKLGWWDEPVSFPTSTALLHSEVSEILEAWRKWEMEDKTPPMAFIGPDIEVLRPPKPEGVASEFADVLIRLLDDDQRYQLNLGDVWDNGVTYGFSYSQYLPENIDAMHNHISRASIAHDHADEPEMVRLHLVHLLVFLRQLANYYRINLMAEYDRKLAYNRTRPYRHGKAV